ncbi:MAG: MCE family protein [Parachlamydiaceae bacterium]|nr:MCE family protein [Parachlamydiaceae bacterium]
MADQTKSVIIGLFVLAAFSIIIFMMLFLHPNVGNEGRILRVRFADIDKINVGTRVTYGGKPVGEVIEIREINEHRGTGPEDEFTEFNGIIYVYELTLAIDSSIEVFTTDDISSRTSGLLGEKSVSIMPRLPLPGQTLILVTDQVLYSEESGSIESTLKDFKGLTEKIERTLEGFIEAFDKLHDQKVWENVGTIAQNLVDITGALNKPKALDSIVDDFATSMNSAKEILASIQEGKGALGKFIYNDDIYNDFSATTNSAKEIFANVQEGKGTLGKLLYKDDIYKDFAATSNSAKEIFASVQEGKGTLGKLLYKDDIYNDLAFVTKHIQSGEGSLGKILVNDDFYLRLASLMSKAEVVLNDINHYGILFHTDKGWKRLRARRMNMIEKLCSPQEFRNYFNDELDSITTSIERVSVVLQKSDEVCPNGGLLFQNPEYLKVYSELLRRVGTLEESLEMYNQQVVDQDVRSVEFLEINDQCQRCY